MARGGATASVARMTSFFATSSRLDTPVRSIMRPGVITVSDDASLRQVRGAIASHGVHAVLVVEFRNARPLGWVSARRVLELADRDPDLTTAGAAVTEPPATIAPAATAREALEKLIGENRTHLLVCRRGDSAAEGVVTDLDLVALLAGSGR
jgi:CBS domain-containing protein